MKQLLSRFNGTAIIISILTFLIGYQFGHHDFKLEWQNYRPSFTVSGQSPPEDKKDIDFKLFWDTWDLVSKNYVDKKAIDPQKMFYGAISGMVTSIGDPYTYFLPPETQKATKEELGGSFEGVGIQLGFNKDKRLTVIAPLKDTPADKAGVKAGDIIVKIDKKDTSNMTLSDAVKIIRGPKGSKLDIELYREGEVKTRTVTLERETIVVKSVEETVKNTPSGKKIAYIKLSRFGEKTFAEWDEAISDILSQGTQGVILDVRNNPGGFLDGAVYIGSEFIDSGNIVLQEDASGQRQELKVNRAGKLLNLPLIILINKGSASASEIVAGAIQDHKRGKLIGEQSFGKGTVQEARDLPGGTGIHITTAKWLTPDGHWIHEIGITPDTKIEPTEEQLKDLTRDLQLEAALQALN